MSFISFFTVREAFENMKKSFDQEIADLNTQLNGISECSFWVVSFINFFFVQNPRPRSLATGQSHTWPRIESSIQAAQWIPKVSQ